MPYFTLARVMLSVLLILAQLGTSVIYAMPVPAGPAGTVPSALTAPGPSGPSPSSSFPAPMPSPVEAPSDPIPPPPSQLPVADQGRLLFAPAMDADGDPSTNPVASAFAPVVSWAGKKVGMIQLAAQIMPLDPAATKAGVAVTFRLWGDQGELISETVVSDGWGAVVLDLPPLETEQSYSYQASAPGYGSTEVRRFRFNPFTASYTVHADGAELTATRLPDQRLRLTLKSSLPLDPTQDEATLTIGRRPQNEPGEELGSEATLGESYAQPVFDALNQTGGRLPFPPVTMQIIDETTAQIDLDLPSGDYRFFGGVEVNRASGSHQLYAIPLDLPLVNRGTIDERAQPIWVADQEHAPHRRLVRYAAPPGQAIFALVDAQNVPDLSHKWLGTNQMVKSFRTGPFEVRQEIYDVQVDNQTADGEIRVALQNLDYDPIARRYTLALQSQLPETVTETLHVEVMGPANVPIWSQESQVVLRPGELSPQTIEVPAERGQPYGMTVTVGGQSTALVEKLMVVSMQKLPASPTAEAIGTETELRILTGNIAIQARSVNYDTSFQFKASMKLYLKILEVDVVAWGYELPPDAWQKIPKQIAWSSLIVQMLDSILYQIWRDAKVALATGGLLITVGVEGQKTLDIKCQDNLAQELLEQSIAGLAAQLNNLAENFPLAESEGSQPKAIKLGPVPAPFALMWWVEGSAGVRMTFAADGATLSVGGQMFADVGINIGWNATLFNDLDDYQSLYAVGFTVSAMAKLVAMMISSLSLILGAPCNQIKPDPKPADDRQDVWQERSRFYRGDTYEETINNLLAQLARARSLGLSRAERALMVDLRQAEAERFLADTQRMFNHQSQVITIAKETNAQVRGLLDGSIPFSPTLTITEAVTAANDLGVEAIVDLPYATHQQTLVDNLESAQQQYAALYGQELALQQELRRLYMAGVVGVINTGFPDGTLDALDLAGLSGQLISLWPSRGEAAGSPAPYLPPQDAPRALVVPTGGMTELAGSPEARAWLESYVAGGGILVVFTQAFGTDWQALPGGQVRGVGYNEDQRCEQESVRAVLPSNWLVWMGDTTPDIQVDGVFTAWPADAKLLLLRTTGTYQGFPAMIEYPFGAGRVLATSAYGDWAVQSAIWWGDDWQMTRSLLIRAYLLANGQDVADLQSVPAAADFDLSFPVVNSLSFTTTLVQARLAQTDHPEWNTVQNPGTLAPGESAVVTATLHTPPTQRGIHNWSQSGLFPVMMRTEAAVNSGFNGWAAFVWVTSPIQPPNMAVSLFSPRPAYRPFEVATVEAQIRNNSGVAQTVILRGTENLPATPITQTLAPGATTTTVYTVTMNASKRLGAALFDLAGRRLNRSQLALHMAGPRLRTASTLPAPLASGTPFTVTAINQPQELAPASPSLTSTLLLTFTLPTGNPLVDPLATPLWSGQQSVPPLAQGQSAPLAFTLGEIGPIRLETYLMWAEFQEQNESPTRELWFVPARVTFQGQFDRPIYRIRETATFSATLRNTGYFDLAPTITATVPALGLTLTRSVILPVGAALTVPITFTLPATLTTQSYPIQVEAEQGGAKMTGTFAFHVPPSWIEAHLEPGRAEAGHPLTVALLNNGGLDSAAAYTLRLGDSSGRIIATAAGSQGVMTGQSAPVSLNVPIGAAAGVYWLSVGVIDQITQRRFSLSHRLTVTGNRADLAVATDRTSYASGQPILAQGAVTAVRGDLTGVLGLRVTGADATGVAVGANQIINANDETGFLAQTKPAIALDGAGNAYAVWQYDDPIKGFRREIYFARRPAGGQWGAAERIDDLSGSNQLPQDPAIAVDSAGGAYVVWDRDNWVIFTYRSPAGVWSANETISDGASGDVSLPGIGVSPSGEATAVWVDKRSDFHGQIYAATRGVNGVWGENQQVNTTVSTFFWQINPAVDVDDAGNVYAVWVNDRNVYFNLRPSGGTWGTDYRVATSTNANLGTDIGVNGGGEAVVLWDGLWAASRSSAGVWSANTKIGSGSSPAVGLDGAGNGYAIWYDFSADSLNNIIFANRPAGGAWTTATRVDDDIRNQDQGEPDIAVDAAGNSVALWQDNRYGDQYDIWGSDRPAGGSWATNHHVSTLTGGAPQYAPALTAGGDGTLYAIWMDYRNESATSIKYDLYFSMKPAGGAWSANEQVDDDIVTDDTNPTQNWPAIAVDGAGTVYALWVDYRTASYNIYFASRPAGGTWSANVKVNDVGIAADFPPDLAVDQAGNAYAIWTDYRNGNHDIYFAHRPAGGTWSANVQVNDGSGTSIEWYPSIAVDGAGNAYAIWLDGRSDSHIYFAYRPSGGVWLPNERVDDVANVVVTGPNDLAVDGAGKAYAVWGDGRNGNPNTYFAYRPANGVWSANELVGDHTGQVTQENPSLTADSSGTVYAVWQDSRNAPTPESQVSDNQNPGFAVRPDSPNSQSNYDIYFAYRPPAGGWSVNQRISDPVGSVDDRFYDRTALALTAPGQPFAVWQDMRAINRSADIYGAGVNISGGTGVAWSKEVPVDTTTTQAVNQPIALANPTVGKYWLLADLSNALGQPLANSATPFYIFPDHTALTLETDRRVVRPGQTVQISGRVTNTSASAVSVPLTVTANGVGLFTQTFALGPSQGAAYATSVTANGDLLIESAAGLVAVKEFVTVAAPQLAASLEVPGIAGYAPFSATLFLTNTGQVDVDLALSAQGLLPVLVHLAPGENQLANLSLTITQTGPISVSISGDVAQVLTKNVAWGLGGEVDLLPPVGQLAGLAAITYGVRGTGGLTTPALLMVHLDGTETTRRDLLLSPGARITDSVLIDLPAGLHTLGAELRDERGVLLAATTREIGVGTAAAPQRPQIEILDVTANPVVSLRGSQPQAAAQTFQVGVTLANRGPAGQVIAGVQIFDTPVQQIITPTAFATQRYTFTLATPTDMPKGDYPGQVTVDDQLWPFVVAVDGPDVGLALATDRATYGPEDEVQLTVTLQERAGLAGDYHLSLRYLDAESFITVTLPANQSLVHRFTFPAQESGRASVALSFVPSGDEAGQRTLMIDSVPILVADPGPGATVQVDRSRYQAGETVHLTVNITGVLDSLILMGPMGLGLQDGDFLVWSPPYDTQARIIPGTYPLTLTLPSVVRTGQYPILAHINGQQVSYPLDVEGVNVTVRRLTLDRANYNPQDVLTATIEFFNETATPVRDLNLTGWLFPPDDADALPVTPATPRRVDLQPGLNVFTVTGSIDTPVVGPHMLGVMVGMPGKPWQVAKGFVQIDIGSAHLVALSTDRGIYALGQAGQGRLDVYGFGPTTLVVTATNGATLLNTTANLTGFGAYTFTLPTNSLGDHLLVAHSTDRTGNRDSRVLAYAVPPPLDTLAPAISITTPATTTYLTTDQPLLSVPVSGRVTDDRGAVTVLVNGQEALTDGAGNFTLNVAMRTGFNLISVVAFDGAGNIAYAPMMAVYLLPNRGMALTVDRPAVAVGRTVTFQAVITATRPLSDLLFSLPLPGGMITDVVATASVGQPVINRHDPAQIGVAWQGMWRGVSRSPSPSAGGRWLPEPWPRPAPSPGGGATAAKSLSASA